MLLVSLRYYSMNYIENKNRPVFYIHIEIFGRICSGIYFIDT